MKCGLVYPGKFTVWITCLIKEYEDAILGGLVKRGYSVSAAGVDAKLSIQEESATIIGISISTENEEAAASDISKVVKEVMDEHKFLYYSIIVSARAGASWYGSNIVLPKKTVDAPPIPTPDRSDMN
jgi:hypothetical protein